MPSDSIEVGSIERLQTFADHLKAYLQKVRRIESEIGNRVARLGHTWQDQEYQRFRAGFQRVGHQLTDFEEAAKQLSPKIAAYADEVGKIHRDSMPR
ncbi:hypothetical protein [uncultured Thiodictyon sp.]|jgi:uncharacterized protein YukE|uniref:hypothetical protein n=1 Tax=uncultured Thiodictyon sp. TaxID=1846217 RepID=UPI0025D5A144|nr:hypothetical protein [uncultured Thiodictyon sp.]